MNTCECGREMRVDSIGRLFCGPCRGKGVKNAAARDGRSRAWVEFCWFLGDRVEFTIEDLMESSDQPRFWCNRRIHDWLDMQRIRPMSKGWFARLLDERLLPVPDASEPRVSVLERPMVPKTITCAWDRVCADWPSDGRLTSKHVAKVCGIDESIARNKLSQWAGQRRVYRVGVGVYKLHEQHMLANVDPEK